MPNKKKKKTVSKKTKKQSLWSRFWEFIFNVIETAFSALKKKVEDKKIAKAGAVVLVMVFLLLGLSLRWSCGKDGFNCSGGYTPPDPDDVKKVIPLVGDQKPESNRIVPTKRRKYRKKK